MKFKTPTPGAKFAAVILIATAVAVSAANGALAETNTDRCGGVLMAAKTLPRDHHKADVDSLGYYKIDGGLVSADGKSTCTSIVIECVKADRICRTARTIIDNFSGRPQVLGVFMDNDYEVTQWTKDTISAEQHPLIGGISQLHITIRDNASDNVQIVNIVKPTIAYPGWKPGDWTTETLTVSDDPARRLSSAQDTTAQPSAPPASP